MKQKKWCPIRNALCTDDCVWSDEDGGCLIAKTMIAYTAKKFAPAIEENKDVLLINPYEAFSSLFTDPHSKNTNGGSQI